ncbi:efflux RND transporter permease subunit [Candidatus Saccharibacteria bacterium]|jgi:multidrug efflux pump subunit AcrB|nr:efflux RND transporter permease subunit [Candidatus Saccharibacteria bacterium]
MRDRVATFCYGVVKHWRSSSVVLAALIGAGIYAYIAVLPREGFPAVQTPLTIVNAFDFNQSADQLDKNTAIPLTKKLQKENSVDSIQTTSNQGSLTAVVSFKDDTDPKQGTELVEKTLKGLNFSGEVEYTTLDPSKYLNKYDALISVYNLGNASIEKRQDYAKVVAKRLEASNKIKSADVKRITKSLSIPGTDTSIDQQVFANSVGVVRGDELRFYDAITIGVERADGVDVLDLSDEIAQVKKDSKAEDAANGFALSTTGDFAKTIRKQVGSLEENILTGVVVVMIISALLIGWRASAVTAVFIIAVIATVMLFFVITDYSLNVITLFALVLTLGLFVDDATIMVEAIDTARRDKKKTKPIVKDAAKKVAVASLSGTLTTALVFVPLLFVTGILGSFIRVMPATVIVALLASYVLSLTLVPLIAYFTMLRPLEKNPEKIKKQLDKLSIVNKLEKFIAEKNANSIMLLKTKPTRGRLMAGFMVGISLFSIGIGGFIFSKLSFNIFPKSKDADQISMNLEFESVQNTIEQTENYIKTANQQINDSIGAEVESVSYGTQMQQPNVRSADAVIQLVPYKDRDVTSSELAQKLQESLKNKLPNTVNIEANQIDSGPPVISYPFSVQVYSEDKQTAIDTAVEIEVFLKGTKVTLNNGQIAKVTKTKRSFTQGVTRIDGKQAIQVDASFDNEQTSAVVEKLQKKVEENFSNKQKNRNVNLAFDFGLESQNADSFSSLGLVFPLALVLMLVVLVVQFRSILQPLLVFMALPFSLLGVALGLYLTDNSISFFSTVGLIGLLGIAVNNTIMLTDYANQVRKQTNERSLVDAISVASRDRFRPLLATTLTTVAALIPLAIFDPFWQPLAIVIIGGLTSSTLLVIVAFPYYYIAVVCLGDKLKIKIARLFKK